MHAVVGASDHIGWAQLVTVDLDAGKPVLVDRRRAELIDPGLSSAPYHHEGLVWPREKTEELVARVQARVTARCREALAELGRAFGARALAIQRSPVAWPVPTAEVLASYQLTCAADGAMYRETLAAEAAALGWVVVRHERRADRLVAAAAALGEERVHALIGEMGRAAGRPWTKEHRESAAAALCVLAARGAVRL